MDTFRLDWRVLLASGCLACIGCTGDETETASDPTSVGEPVSDMSEQRRDSTGDARASSAPDASQTADDPTLDDAAPDSVDFVEGRPEAAESVPSAGDVPDEGKALAAPGECLAGIQGYDEDGPFRVRTDSSGRVKMWVPEVPSGCRVPVIHLANGTGASCGVYRASLERLATHGFLATCYENANTGAGTQGIQALEAAFEEYPDLADMRIGSTGHSQGGQAAFVVLQFAEERWGDRAVYAGLAMQPASGFGDQPRGQSWREVYAKIKSPMFMFSGTADTLVPESWVRSALAALSDSVEAYWWSANGAAHIPVPNRAMNQVSVAWFRWKLLGDKAACAYFKALPDTRAWDERRSQNAMECE